MPEISIENKKFVGADPNPHYDVDKLAIMSILNDNPDDTQIFFNFCRVGESGELVGIIKNDANQEKAISSVISAQAALQLGYSVSVYVDGPYLAGIIVNI